MSFRSTLKITYIGHASLLIEIDGVRLLTDPILRDSVWHLRRYQGSIESAWYQDIDAVLISHLHWDHLDIPSLKLLDERTRLIAPQGTAAVLKRHKFQHIEELAVNSSTTVGSVQIQATYAHHDGRRFRFGPEADSLGFIIQGQQTIYFAGDTDLFPEMADLTDALDLALLPVWGWGPTLGKGHLDPYRAALSLKWLRPRVAVPIHWGTYFPAGLDWFLSHRLTEPPHTFAAFAAKVAPQIRIRVIPPGESTQLLHSISGK